MRTIFFICFVLAVVGVGCQLNSADTGRAAAARIEVTGVFVGHNDDSSSLLKQTLTVSRSNQVADTIYNVTIDGIEHFLDFRKGQPDKVTHLQAIGYFNPSTGLMQVPAKELTLVYQPDSGIVQIGALKYYRRKQ